MSGKKRGSINGGGLCAAAALSLGLLMAAGWAASAGAGAAEAEKRVSPEGGKERQARIAAVTGAVFAGSEAVRNLEILCDGIGGRISGTPSGKKARDFAERVMNGYGLENVHQEPFDIFIWENLSLSCMAVSPIPFTLHPVPLANTPSTPKGGLEAEVIDVGHGNPAELETLGGAVRGRIALAVSGVMPGGRWMHRSEVMAAVAEAGAAGLLYQTTTEGHLPMTGMCWKKGVSPIPGIGIAREDGEWIRRHLEKGEKVVLRIEMENVTGRGASANVVGEIHGKGADHVIVAAHLDSWALGQGAVDNGTGTAAVLEAARAISVSGVRPEATIKFVLFMGEESGLCGSEAYAALHGSELDRCRAMINCDMEGTPAGIRVMGHEEAGPWFESLIEDLSSFGLDEGLSFRPGIYGDQRPFLLAGVPVLAPVSRFTEDSDRYYHTWADTFDKVVPRELTLASAFLAALALEVSMTPERAIQPLDRAGVTELVEKYGLAQMLELWGNWPLPPSGD